MPVTSVPAVHNRVCTLTAGEAGFTFKCLTFHLNKKSLKPNQLLFLKFSCDFSLPAVQICLPFLKPCNLPESTSANQQTFHFFLSKAYIYIYVTLSDECKEEAEAFVSKTRNPQIFEIQIND